MSQVNVPPLTPSAEPLPLWMQRAQRGSDWGLLLAFLIGLCAAWGFITHPALARTNDAEHAVFRADDEAAAIAEGRWYPRWSAHAFGGYGAPIAHFSPPLPGLLPGAIQVLFAARAVDAVRIVFIGAFVFASISTYALAARWTDARGGVIAAALYTLSPYVCLSIPHLLGSLPLMMAAACVPCLWWSLDRLAAANGAFDFAAVTLTAALLMLIHPASAIGALLVGGVLSLFHAEQRGQALTRIAGAGALGILGAACFWLPALLDALDVRWIAANAPLPRLDLRDILTPVRTVDPGEFRPAPTFSIGWTGVFAVGCALWRWPALLRRGRVVFGLSLGIIAAGVMFAPTAVWLMALATLGLALSAGSVLARFSPTRPLVSAVILLTVFTLSAPAWLSPAPPAENGRYDAEAQIDYELSGFGSALMPAYEPIPTTLVESIVFDRTLLNSYQTDTVDRLRPAARTNAQLGLIVQGTHFTRYQFSTLSPTIAELLISAFPGWNARINDTLLPLEVTPDTGLMTLELPPGRGELLISLDTTPRRTFAWWVTWTSLALAGAISLRRRSASSRSRTARAETDVAYLSAHEARLIALVVIGWACAIALFGFSRIGYPAPGSQLDGVSLRARTDTGLEVIAFDGLREAYSAAETAEITLFWQAQQRVDTALQTRLFWLDLTTGAQRGQTAPQMVAHYSPQRWLLNRYVRDPYSLPLNMLPAGDYALGIELLACELDCSAQLPRAFFDADGSPLGQTLILPVRVRIGTG